MAHSSGGQSTDDLCQRLQAFAATTLRRELLKLGDSVEELVRQELVGVRCISEDPPITPVVSAHSSRDVEAKRSKNDSCFARDADDAETGPRAYLAARADDFQMLSRPRKTVRKTLRSRKTTVVKGTMSWFRSAPSSISAQVPTVLSRGPADAPPVSQPYHALTTDEEKEVTQPYHTISTDESKADESKEALPLAEVCATTDVLNSFTTPLQAAEVGDSAANNTRCIEPGVQDPKSELADAWANSDQNNVPNDLWSNLSFAPSADKFSTESDEGPSIIKRRRWAMNGDEEDDQEIHSAVDCYESREAMKGFLSSQPVSILVSTAVVVNAAVLGYQTEYAATSWSHDRLEVCEALNKICCCVFVVDMVLRLFVYRFALFTSSEWKWSVFDVVMVSDQVFEEFFAFDNGTELSYVAVLRLLRVFRLFRILRTTRLLAFAADLRMIVVSISTSIRSLVSALILLVMMEFCLGVYFTQAVTLAKVKADEHDTDIATLEVMFGTLVKSMLTLYKAISSGVNWGELQNPLARAISPWMTLIMCVYVAFSLMALLNVITSIFLGNAIRVAEEDRKQVLVWAIKNVFNACDSDKSGTISWEEFLVVVDSEDSEPFFKEIDMCPDDALKLFKLLDVDESGELNADELISGCLRLEGHCKAIDFAAFIHDFWRWTRKWEDHANSIERALGIPASGLFQNKCPPLL
eukprot:TRINITY_DN74799_c0_g1_i1.p1 TRINITY_DN74799_c0_g1~~TRINITY_DN74799_c0_g1_i1.p1  ORF type:complete len:695 (+),score=132.01 TRINITY_DN74799_c0_g1_i1:175-2259(+)